ncbi:MAG: CDP-alcohol phosphatidyltransferase family protein [Myxococcota bacterium]
MIKERLGSDLDAVVYRLFPFVRSLPFHPDTLTLTGAAVSLFAGCAFAYDRPFLAGLLLMIAGFFDLVDGVVARQQGVSSSAGAFFDSSIDRLSDLLIFAGIAVGQAHAGDATDTALVMWALGASVMTSYTRASAEKRLHSLKVGFVERGERFGVLILGALTGFVMTAVVAIAIGATITSVQRLLAGRRLLSELDATGVDPTREEATRGG